MTERDNNNMESHQYHEIHFSQMTGFPSYHETNIDRICQFLDSSTFKSILQLGEQDKAYSIDYAHGLELDDMYGDPFSIPRNGLDDVQYRFILKCHILAIKSNGTLPELLQFISTVLGCSEDDVTLGLARHYINNRWNGPYDTIEIKNINIENVANDQLVPLLANELQYAVAADKRVLDVDFLTINTSPVWTAVGNSFRNGINLNIPKAINDAYSDNISNNVGASNTISNEISLDIPRDISNEVAINDGLNTLNTESTNAKLGLDYPNSVNNKNNSNIKNGIRIDFNASAKNYSSSRIDYQTVSREVHVGVSTAFGINLEV